MWRDNRRLAMLIGLAGALAVVLIVVHVVLPWVRSDKQDNPPAVRRSSSDKPAAGGSDPDASGKASAPRRPAAYPEAAAKAPTLGRVRRISRQVAREASPEDIAVLKEAAHDPSPAVRVEANLGLGRVKKDQTDPQTLIESLKNDPSAEVRAAAALSLGRQKCIEAGEALIAALSDPDLTVRSRAGAAMRNILGIDMGYRPNDPSRDRAIRRIREFWPKFYEGRTSDQATRGIR